MRRSRRPLAKVNQESAQAVYRSLGRAVHAMMTLLVWRDWRHHERVPQSGGVLFISNHISYFDPLAVGDYLIWSGRWPRFLGKAEIWSVPALGWLARSCGQIPVQRNTPRAVDALAAAGDAIAQGKAVLIYPEGTVTADPDTWPMTARSGAARLALTTRCPVVPVGQYGANLVMPGKRPSFPRFFPRKTMRALTGEPLDLSDLQQRYDEGDRSAVREAGERFMDAITDLVSRLRDEEPPEGRYDIRVGRRLPRLERPAPDLPPDP